MASQDVRTNRLKTVGPNGLSSPKAQSDPARPHNLILQQMPEAQYANLARHLVPLDLPTGFQLSEPGQPIEYVYFPTAGLVSINALTGDGECVEVGVLGWEGLTGYHGLLNHDQAAHSVLMQAPGYGLRVRTNLVREEFLKGGSFAQQVHTLIYLQMTQVAQSVLCNRLHSIDKRMARWMLTACDRMQTDSLQLTQEFLAQMLGSRRSTVTVAAGEMQRDGLIEYRRGKIQIKNRPGLEKAACECYSIVRDAYHRLLGGTIRQHFRG